MQGAGAVNVLVSVHAGSALNTAVTVQLFPLEGKLLNVYVCGLVNGALNV
jgi:hypothetical protein